MKTVIKLDLLSSAESATSLICINTILQGVKEVLSRLIEIKQIIMITQKTSLNSNRLFNHRQTILSQEIP